MTETLYVLDVSGSLYRAYFALPTLTNPQGAPSHALYGFLRFLLKLFDSVHPQAIVAVYDGADNKQSRKLLYADYKANRTQRFDDLYPQIEASKEFLVALGIPYMDVAGVEADDTIYSLVEWGKQSYEKIYVVTSDKDLCQLVDERVSILNPFPEYQILGVEEVLAKFGVLPRFIPDLLALMGDASDHIPGVPGIGAKTAVQLIQAWGTLENILLHARDIPGKKGVLLEQHQEVARLSKELATLRCVTLPYTQFSRGEVQVAVLRKLYETWNFRSLITTLPKQYSEDIPCSRVVNREDLETLIQQLEKAPSIGIRCLFSGESPFCSVLLGIGFGGGDRIYYVPCQGALPLEEIVASMRSLFEKQVFFGHDLKQDIHVLAHHGLIVHAFSFDTIIASYLLNTNEKNHSLDALVLHYQGRAQQELSADSEQEQRCSRDIQDIMQLKGILHTALEREQLDVPFFTVDLPLLPVLVQMEETGVFVDVGVLETLHTQFLNEITKIKDKIFVEAEFVFNIHSPKQLQEVLFKRLNLPPLKKTTTGFSTDAEVLEELAINFPICALILEYRSLEKLRSTYLEALPKQIHPNTGRIHPTFNQAGTATGRLSCQDPNLQNIPIRSPEGKEIRKAFRPQKPGYRYLAADYSQIELRLLAHFSQDPGLMHAFQQGVDIHVYTAALIHGVKASEVTETMRYQAKAINFGILYGQQAFGLSKQLRCDQATAQQFIEAYFTQFSTIKHFFSLCLEKTQKEGYATTLLGHKRAIPGITSKNTQVRKLSERLAINTPLQGSAADLIKIAMIRINQFLPQKAPHTEMILQIHDELLFEGPEDEIDAIQDLIQRTMEEAIALHVPLVVNLSIGENWGAC